MITGVRVTKPRSWYAAIRFMRSCPDKVLVACIRLSIAMTCVGGAQVHDARVADDTDMYSAE